MGRQKSIVVSNKFSKKAVERNRIKRIFREIVGNNLEKIGKDNIWVVIHPKISCQNKGYEEISAEFNKILQEAPFS